MGQSEVYESSVYFSRHASVERTPSSAAFDLALDVDLAKAKYGPSSTVEERRFSAA
jgi:hypothetical protein